MPRSRRQYAIVLAAGGVAVLACSCSAPQSAPPSEGASIRTTTASGVPPGALDSEYQAVLLTNGQVLFGKLEGLGTPFPTLREVHYVQTVPAPDDEGKTTNVLVKRGLEWHAPDHMVLNAEHIVLVEPVRPGSKVAQLIAEQKRTPADRPPDVP